MILNKVVLVTGISGAGKTTAMAVLEDMGYHCIDRYPVFLIDELIELLQSNEEDERLRNLALSVSAHDFFTFKQAFENMECDLTILYLDASYDALLLRYKYNRRSHPLLIQKKANSLEEAIEFEIASFYEVREYATIIIDTSHLSVHDLSKRIQAVFSISSQKALTISFVSFGFRHGVPGDADMVVDVRFLANPYWEVSLREKSGNDRVVYDYVLEDDKTQAFLKTFIPYLEFVLDQYTHDSKNHLTVAIGCTGGQHRSVSLVNWLQRQYREAYPVFINHRDVKGQEDA